MTQCRRQRSILGVFRKDKVTNEEVRAGTGKQSTENSLSEIRPRWLGWAYGRPEDFFPDGGKFGEALFPQIIDDLFCSRHQNTGLDCNC